MEINTTYLSNLARIHASRVTNGLKSSIESILSFVDNLSSSDVVTPKPTLYNVTKSDEVKNFSFSKEILYQNFPTQQDGYLVVPQILKSK